MRISSDYKAAIQPAKISMPMVKRGQIVSNDDGDLFLVWSATMGIVHAHPLLEDRTKEGVFLRARFSVTFDGQIYHHDMWLDADTRRHLPVGSVTVHPSNASDLIPGLATKLKQLARKEDSIRSAYLS